ncbi:hypothetical protein [Streptomyces sp. NPDC059783]|uniref:hypothetical protein n=2 Tax=unclassified Streptomyces TaxID=2593676 RepID=UPI003654722A
MRKLTTLAVTGALFFGGMGAAVAGGWSPVPTLKTTGAVFVDGAYKWEPKGKNHGGFHFKGNLADAKKGDGNNVYMQVRVEGYSWNRLNGKQGKTVHLDKIVYDGAAQYTRKAWIRTCRDRGSLHPDNCSYTKRYAR